MPVTYRFDDELRCVHTRCFGDATLDEIFSHFRQLSKDTTLPQPLNVLLDLTELTSFPESGQLISVAAEVRRVDEQIAFGACAIAARDDLPFGAGRIFERLVQGTFTRSRTLRDVAAARAWLADPR